LAYNISVAAFGILILFILLNTETTECGEILKWRITNEIPLKHWANIYIKIKIKSNKTRSGSADEIKNNER